MVYDCQKDKVSTHEPNPDIKKRLDDLAKDMEEMNKARKDIFLRVS